MFVGINGPGNLDLWFFDLETGVRVASKVGNLHSEFAHSRPSGSRVIRYLRDGRTMGGQMQRIMPLPYTGESIITDVNSMQSRHELFIIIKPPLATEKAASFIGPVHLFVCLFVCLSVCLSACRQIAKRDFLKKLSNLELWCLLTTYRKSYIGFSKKPLLDP